MPRSSSPAPRAPVTPPSTRGPIFPLVVIGIVLAAALVLRISRWMREPATAPIAPQATTADADVSALMQNLARHITVPSGESPTIATIQDVHLARAQNPVLYREAQNGDRLLVWSNELVVFSPSRDRVIAVVPMAAPTAPTATSTSTAAVSSTTPIVSATSTPAILSIEIRNGSSVVGLAKRASEALKKTSTFNVLPFAAAKRKDYAQTLIVIPAGMSSELVQRITSVIAGTPVAAVPSGEVSSTADILVILGQDASSTY